ncbi:PilZ domain-containing protein [bacterium CPR1]|nr:PilZ domain-containing protein [bacterium CPR1]
MLNFLKKKDEDGPAVQVLGYQNQVVRVLSPSRLSMNAELTLKLILPDSSAMRVSAVLLTEENAPGRGVIYQAELQGGPEVGDALVKRLQAPAPQAQTSAAGERRRWPRVEQQVQVISRQLPGFVAMASNLAEGGMRLHLSAPVAERTGLLVAFDVDDTAPAPIQVQAEVVYCQDHRDGSYWVGVCFVGLPPGQENAVEKLHRALQQMRKKPGSKAYSIEP